MIKIYYESSNDSCRKATKWFETMDIKVSMKMKHQISKEDLLHILILSNGGFTSILKHTGNIRIDSENMRREITEMTFSDGLNYVLDHTDVLRTPIIFDEDKLLVGYNSDDIRKFISRDYRRLNKKW
jgi:regulatory protein spx